MQMPVMHGYEATTHINSHPLGKETVIVALTASAFEEDRKTILAAGCNDFMRKPFEAKILFAKIEDVCPQENFYNIRVDTNFDNLPMLKILDKLNYSYCGEVIMGGAPRRAYQKELPKNL